MYKCFQLGITIATRKHKLEKVSNQARQGGVFIERIKPIPNEAKKNKSKDNLIVMGEGYIHGYFALAEDKKDIDIFISKKESTDGLVVMYINFKKEGNIEHIDITTGAWTKEHHALKASPGIYRIVRQRQYNPYEAKAIEMAD